MLIRRPSIAYQRRQSGSCRAGIQGTPIFTITFQAYVLALVMMLLPEGVNCDAMYNIIVHCVTAVEVH